MRPAERRTPFPALRPSLSTSSPTGPWREDEPAARKVTVATMAREGQETHAAGVGVRMRAPASAGLQKERASSLSTRRSVCARFGLNAKPYEMILSRKINFPEVSDVHWNSYI